MARWADGKVTVWKKQVCFFFLNCNWSNILQIDCPLIVLFTSCFPIASKAKAESWSSGHRGGVERKRPQLLKSFRAHTQLSQTSSDFKSQVLWGEEGVSKWWNPHKGGEVVDFISEFPISEGEGWLRTGSGEGSSSGNWEGEDVPYFIQ